LLTDTTHKLLTMSRKHGRDAARAKPAESEANQMMNYNEEDDLKYEVEDDLQEHRRYNHDEEQQNNDQFTDEIEDSLDQHSRGDEADQVDSSQDPPTSDQNQRVPPPPNREGSSQDVNENFQDVEATGKWGSLSKIERIVAGVVVLGVIIGIVLVLVLVVFPGNEEDKKAAAVDLSGLKQDENNTFSMGPFLDVPAQDQLDTVLLLLNRNKHVSSDLSDDANFYENYDGDDVKNKAIVWLLSDEEEPATDDPWLIYRYALANIYFALGGDGWSNNGNWLSKRHACEWDGLNCNLKQNLIEIDLSSNNVTGVLPPEFSLLEDVRSLLLSRNNINGEAPWDALGSMKSLSILYLDDNNLSGTYSEGIIANGILSTVFIQQNNLTGKWPRSLCPLQGQPSNFIFDQLRLDCYDGLSCYCCTQWNCF